MENEIEQPELIRYALLKKRNKRIEIFVLKDPSDGKIAVSIDSKRLVGDWKERNIRTSSVCYGVESFMVINDVFNLLLGDPLFLKSINRELGQIGKDKMTCSTNIKR